VVLSTVVLAAGVLRQAVPPVEPDGDEARRWAEQELSDPAYAASEPTFFDRAARAVADFLAGLIDPQLGGGWGPVLAVVALVVVAAVVIVAFLVWGRPRAVRRSRTIAADLFGEVEGRSAGELRRDAEAAAERSDWNAAIVLRFRALARGLDERAIVDLEPGATVHRFARLAARAFPEAAPALEGAASAFDDVRYLRLPGTAELYRSVSAADEAVIAATPRTASAGVPA
jgi:hypothetical protein